MEPSPSARRSDTPDELSPWIRGAIWLASAVLLVWIGWFAAIGALIFPFRMWDDGTPTLVVTALWAVPGAVALLLSPAHLCSMTFDRFDPLRSRLTLWMTWSLGTAFGVALVLIVLGRLTEPTL
jgi:hypothetical protein